MNKGLFFIISFFLLFLQVASAQMIEGNNTLYGNEWIDYDKTYYKFQVSADGIYKIGYQELLDAGFTTEELIGTDFQIHEFGVEIPILVTTDEIFSPDDYILFYGRKNRGEIDKYLYELHDKQLNPEYSLFTDTLTYFINLNPGRINERYEVQDNDLNVSLPEKESFYWHEEKIVNTHAHFKPTYAGSDNVTYSHLDITEGFGSPMQQYNEHSLDTDNFYPDGGRPYLNFRLATSFSPNHKTDVRVNGRLIDNIYTTGYTVTDQIYELENSDMQDVMTFIFEGTDVSTPYTDRNSQPIVSLTYPRSFHFPGMDLISFNVRPSSFMKYYEIADLNLNAQNVMLLDPVNGHLTYPEYDSNNSLIKFKISPSTELRTITIFNNDQVPQTISSFEKVTFIDYADYDEEYIIISHHELFKEFNGVNQVEAYADYRSSFEGGAYKSIIVDVEQLYDQFGYGINRHSQSINNFANYIKVIWTNPSYFFIIGKGRDYVGIRTDEELKDPSNLFYVPSYGYHGSDVLLVAKKGLNAPDIPVGRIAVKNTEQIEEYLNKIKEHENYEQYDQTLEEKEWMKKIIHLSGGDPDIQQKLRDYLDDMGQIIANSTFGANVVTYGRTSGTATEAVTDKIVTDINDGASMITFFGHSGVSTSDFNIGELENDKYPLFLSLGCYSGDIHTNYSNGQSEKFVLSQSGVIAFIGSAGTAYITPQYVLGKDFYERLGNELYGKTVGKALSDVLDLNKDNQTLSIKSLNQQFTLHGDPAIRLNPHLGPDYTCDFESVRTSPEIINSNENEFIFSFDVVNLGNWVGDSLRIELFRKYPDASQDTISLKIAAPYYRTTVEIPVKTGNTKATGENCIYVTLDPYNEIEELISPIAEQNNELANDLGEVGYCFFIINNGAKPIYPDEFSIVNKEEIRLKASTYNYFIEPQNFVFQIDTTELYNSPLMVEHKASFPGGILEWEPPVDFEENRVYYWRISPDSTGTGLGYLWASSSFIYLPESSEGWNQSHYYQFLRDEADGVNPHNWRFEYDDEFLGVVMKNKKYDGQKIVFVNGGGWSTFNKAINTSRPCLNIVGIGPRKLFSYNPDGNYGNIDLGKESYTFKTNTIDERKGIKQALEDMPDSTTVFIYTILDDNVENGLDPETWAQDSVSLGYNLFSVLEEYGATQVRKMETKGTVPYLFVFKKGGKVLGEKIGKDFDDVIELTTIASIKQSSGELTSTLIGPVAEWNELIWQESKKSDTETSLLSIYKVKKDLSESLIVDSLENEYQYDLNEINSDEFPYLKLKFSSSDETEFDPTHIDFLRVHYIALPDAALLMDNSSLFHKDTLHSGDNLKFRATVWNNSMLDMDSLNVEFNIKKPNNSILQYLRRFSMLKAQDTIHIDFSHGSSELEGINEFSVEINPDKDPEEKYYFNNIGIQRFYVRTDNQNPILDVTFDGIHIMDGDIISPKPEIYMTLKDENQFLLLNDPSIFTKIQLKYPSGNVVDIPIDSELLEFIPAESSDKNIAKMILRPDLDEGGEYTFAVQAKDLSNNLAGEHEYTVNFRVILEQKISNVYNYPNPFTTSTQFIFTLTGSEVPEQLMIRILTLSGKVVREIHKDELGPIKIGNNITEYSWDGRDTYGNKLGNGVYLYQVIAKKANGEDYSILENGESDTKFFKNGWGKMAIVR